MVSMLNPYKGVVRRFLVLLRHVFGLLAGGVVAQVRALPPAQRQGLHHLGRRAAAALFQPLLNREIAGLPFPGQLRRRLELAGPDLRQVRSDHGRARGYAPAQPSPTNSKTCSSICPNCPSLRFALPSKAGSSGGSRRRSARSTNGRWRRPRLPRFIGPGSIAGNRWSSR